MGKVHHLVPHFPFFFNYIFTNGIFTTFDLAEGVKNISVAPMLGQNHVFTELLVLKKKLDVYWAARNRHWNDNKNVEEQLYICLVQLKINYLDRINNYNIEEQICLERFGINCL